MSTVAERPPIDEACAAEYREKGFIVVEDVYSAADIGRMRRAIDELVGAAAGIDSHDDVYDLEPSHARERPRVRRIKKPYRVHPVFMEMAKHPRLVAILARLIGPDLRLHGGKINLKSAGYGAPVEWHQDWAFYPHTNDDVLAVGVMLDDMTEDNGPLLIIPGSHRGPTHDHHQDGRFVGAIDPTACGIDFSTAETVTGRAGACSFHHVRAVHGSAQNTSGRDRRLLLYQVAAADAWDLRGLTEGSWEAHRATMLAGEPSIEPRVVPAPVRLPYPGPERAGSIYESQSVLRHRFFGARSSS
ncbi:MAG: phytanoyl-CoA dioxygenase family protein [Gammaproteobacteria bacterium]|nr:phytanoyl-CoA dioxygenase family protein [Gammaproteobacteria bacterium]